LITTSKTPSVVTRFYGVALNTTPVSDHPGHNGHSETKMLGHFFGKAKTRKQGSLTTADLVKYLFSIWNLS